MKNKKIRIIKSAITIVGVLLLAVVAFVMPKTIYSLYDRQTLGKEERLEMETVAYERGGSFEEQLKSFCMCINDSDRYKMSSVRMEEGNSSVSNEQLTDIVNNELVNFSKEDFAGETDAFILNSAQLVTRQLYTVYITVPENKAGRDSISLWLLDYKMDNNYKEIEILIDMEYHKIYDVWIYADSFEKFNVNYGEENSKQLYVSDYAKYTDKSYLLTQNIEAYYGIDQYYEIFVYEQNYLEDVSEEYDNDNVISESLESFGIAPEVENEVYMLPVAEVFGKNERGVYKRVGIDKIRNILQL